jgi:AcrR family transcriptional regulator
LSELSNASRTTRKPKGEGHSRRGEILAAAERIFVEHGYEGATIRKIADEVGLSSTALYMHFPDKGAILQEICRNAFSVLTAAAAAVLHSGLR